MNRSQSVSNPTTPPDPDRERIDCHQRAMAQLIEIGMALAETLRPQAAAADAVEPGTTEPVPAVDPSLRFSRIARVVVLAVTTEGRIIANRRNRADERAAVAARGDKVRRVMRVERLMEEAITRAMPDEDDAADLRDELYCRFEDLDPEVDIDFVDRPIGETIDRLCRDLGWSRTGTGGRRRTGRSRRPGTSRMAHPMPAPGSRFGRRASIAAGPPGRRRRRIRASCVPLPPLHRHCEEAKPTKQSCQAAPWIASLRSQ